VHSAVQLQLVIELASFANLGEGELAKVRLLGASQQLLFLAVPAILLKSIFHTDMAEIELIIFFMKRAPLD